MRLLVVAVVCALTGFGLLTPAQAQPTKAAGHTTPNSATARNLVATTHEARALARDGRTQFRPAARAVSPESYGSPSHRNSSGRAVPLGTATQSFDMDTSTGTAYVSSDDGTVSVVDVGHCNIHRSGSCAGPIAELPGPVEGIGVAVYKGTLYVTSGVSGTNGVASVYDIRRCHAGDTSGCGAPVATVPLADIPVGVVLDAASGTLYVGNVADHVDVLALASCRSGRLSGCHRALIGSIPAKDGPVFPTLDAARHTLYVPANGPDADGSGDTVHVVGLRHCRAGDTSGCSATEGSLPADVGAVVAFEDSRTGTLYVQNQSASTVSVLDVRHCSGADRAGCAQTPTQVPVGSNPSGGFAETADGRLYVANSDSDTLSTIDTRHCRAGDTAGCPTSPPPTARADGAPFALAYDPATGTIFTVEHAGRALGVLDANVCGRSGAGCRKLLPAIDGNEQQLADPATHTWYGADENGDLTLTDTRVCTARHAARCAGAAIHTSLPNTTAGHMVADDSTHSLYLVEVDQTTFQGTLVVLDTRTCNATTHADCAPVAPPMPLPDFTAIIALDRATHTVYITTQHDSSLQVVDGTRCNAVRHSGCSAPEGAVPLDGNVYGIATDDATHTVYVSEFGDDFEDDVVYAVDSTHCHATDVSGCGADPKHFTSGLAPLSMVDDAARHALYVLANAGGPKEGQVDVFDTRTCSARGVGGCTPKAAFDVARAPYVADFDPVTQRLFIGAFEHAAVTVIDTSRCNATTTRGCHDHEFDIGDHPGEVSVDPVTHSVFVYAVTYDKTYYFDTRRC